MLAAFACKPGQGSEPGVGWHWAVQAAAHHDVWLLTPTFNRSAIEAELARRPIPSLHPVYHEIPRWAAPLL